MKILFTGGGTGGHIYPIVTIKKTLEKLRSDTKFMYIGPNGFAKEALKEIGVECKFILAGKLRRYVSPLTFIDLFKIPLGFIQSLWHVFWFMPDVIFGKGGYGSIPVVIVGWLYRIPIIIHESDSIPGLANKILSRLAKKIIISFEETKKYFNTKKTILLGNPIREEFTQGSREEGKRLFEISSTKPVALVMGGSQGAEKINDIVLNVLPRLLEKCEIIHLCGEKNFKRVKAGSQEELTKFDLQKAKLYHLYSFLDIHKLKHAYAISDIIISRAGAGGIFEIATIGKPGILIPLSTAASDHQRKNAQALAKTGGAIILEEENLTMNMFLDAVFGLIDNPEKAKEIGEKAKSFYNPSTNQKIAEEIIKLCQ